MIEVSKQTLDEMQKHVGHKLTFVKDNLGFPTLVCLNEEHNQANPSMEVIAEFYANY